MDYLDKAIARATTEGIDGLIRGPLGIAKRVRQSNLETLKRVEKALNPDTPLDVARKAINKQPETLPPSLAIVKKNAQDYHKKIDNLESEVERNIMDNGLRKMNPAEYAKRSVDLCWKMATLTYQHLLDATAHDPMAKKDLEARRIEVTTEMAKQHLTEYKSILHLLTFEDKKKLMFSMMIQDLLAILAVNGASRITQFENRIGNIFQRLMGDLLKTVDK